jgi:Tetratricopeptide repeat
VEFGGHANPEYYDRLREVLSASRRTATALVAAAGLAALGVYGHAWAFIPATGSTIFAFVDSVLAWRGFRAAEASDIAELLAGQACLAAQARALEYGVDSEALPKNEAWHYVPRDFEQDLRHAIIAALSGQGSRLVLLCGATKSGKTRAAFHALECEDLADAWLVVPRDGASVERLLRPGTLPRSWRPLVVWLDDLERYVSVDASGLSEGSLRNLKCDRPVVVLGTVGGRGSEMTAPPGMIINPVEQLKALARCIHVPVKLTPRELALAARSYRPVLVQEIEEVGLGRRMVAISEVAAKLTPTPDRGREGLALVRAAIDWRRAGAQRPLRTGELQVLYQRYLPDELDQSDELFERGLRWAREPLPGTRIALLGRTVGGGYEPYDLAVQVASTIWPPPTGCVLERIASIAEPTDCFQMAGAAFEATNRSLALDLLARAEHAHDRRLTATSAYNIGVLLADSGDIAGAEAAYRRADERGSQRAAFNLGQMLKARGDLTSAEAAYRRADERGSPEAAVNLGVLLEQRGALACAQAAYRRAQERGSRKGAANLTRLISALEPHPTPREAAERVGEDRSVRA